VVVKDFITEHHGTMEISFFLERAKHKKENGDHVQVEEYRYPGPRPRSVETAVAMLADGVEAAIRVLDDPSPERLRDAIDHIVGQRVQSGQLDDAPLTMAQLSKVKDEFARVIGGTYHNRIDYPEGSGGLSADWEAASDS
jgi:membrane-associated HD superfamily phosphohydrolase